ncbi:MAG TPA: hypothetical protein VF932_19095, partial [Anaerolineae bacterium]
SYESRLEAELLVIPMPDGKDPDELIHDDPARWVGLVNNAEPLVDFYFRALTQDLDLKTARDKSTAAKRLVPIIQEIDDTIQRAHYAQQLARLIQVPEQTIAQQLARKPSRTGRREAQAQSEQAGTGAPEVVSRLEEYCLTLVLHSPQDLERIAFLEEEDFSGATPRALFFALQQAGMDLTERDRFRSRLDESLVPLYDRLSELEQNLPALNGPDLAREIETTAYRLRLQRDRAELTQIEVMLRDQDMDRTDEDARVLYERVNFLRKRIDESQKALSARGLFKPRYLQ